jgi:periplasmic divalent cation tolerance protein
MTQARVVLTTCGSKDEAQKIARAVVERRVAACVNIIAPVESIYRWEERVESATEWLLLIKSTAEKSAVVCNAIRELHSYDLPECIVISIEDGSAEYLKWIEKST